MIKLNTKQVANNKQTKAWAAEVNGKEVSIVRWVEGYYNNKYEIFSFERLFEDVERYDNLDEVIDRLEELEKK